SPAPDRVQGRDREEPARQGLAAHRGRKDQGDHPQDLSACRCRAGARADGVERAHRQDRPDGLTVFEKNLLKGKRILVTGGGTGLGREMAAKYLELGAEVFICGRRKDPLEKTAAELTAKHGGSMKTRTVDIRDAAAVDAMVQSIWDDGGPLTGLLNNAAGNFISRTEDLSSRGFDAIAN